MLVDGGPINSGAIDSGSFESVGKSADGKERVTLGASAVSGREVQACCELRCTGTCDWREGNMSRL